MDLFQLLPELLSAGAPSKLVVTPPGFVIEVGKAEKVKGGRFIAPFPGIFILFPHRSYRKLPCLPARRMPALPRSGAYLLGSCRARKTPSRRHSLALARLAAVASPRLCTGSAWDTLVLSGLNRSSSPYGLFPPNLQLRYVRCRSPRAGQFRAVGYSLPEPQRTQKTRAHKYQQPSNN